MMKTPRRVILIFGVAALFASCNSVQDEREEALENRINRQDDRLEDRSERRRRRAETEDQRYEDWFNRVMNRPRGA